MVITDDENVKFGLEETFSDSEMKTEVSHFDLLETTIMPNPHSKIEHWDGSSWIELNDEVREYKEKLTEMSKKELKIEALTCEEAWKRKLIRVQFYASHG